MFVLAWPALFMSHKQASVVSILPDLSAFTLKEIMRFSIG